MPRDHNGVHSLPQGYRATDGETIRASQHNPPLEDLSQGVTDSLPRNGSAAMTGDLDLGGNEIERAKQASKPDSVPTLAQVQSLIPNPQVVPSGAISFFAGETLPANWLWADGSIVSRTTYAALFNAIGVTFGAGDGTTTFALPNLSGYFPRFTARGGAIDPGRTLGTVQAEATKAHTHTATTALTDPGHYHTTTEEFTVEDNNASFGGARPVRENSPSFGTVNINTNSVLIGMTAATTVDPTIGAETRPINIALNAIIKT